MSDKFTFEVPGLGVKWTQEDKPAVTLADLIAQHGIKASSRADDNPPDADHWADASHWRVTLSRKDKRLTVPFHMGAAHTGEPQADQVLDCLLSDANSPEDFEEFCAELGFDADSRKAEKTHRACLAISAKLRKFLGSDFETFMSAERL